MTDDMINMGSAKKQDFYDGIAEGYDELYMTEQLRKMTEVIIALGADVPKKNELLLDVGCGTGVSTSVWSCRCVGIDPSKELIKKAKQKLTKNSKNAFLAGEGEHLPFKDKSFDIVICITAIHNFKDIRQGILEIKRVCKNRAVITVLRKSSKIEDIEKWLIINFRIKKIVLEEKDMIFVCGIR
jgi:ubiquinone/menaquinone biosynthesis C-methylase UbiE